MKKFVLLVVLALALATTTYAGWWKTYGGPDHDIGDCVQITSGGNYIISGKKDNDLWLLKIDTSGNMLWENTYDRTDGRTTRWIEETSDGGYIVAPRTPSLLKVNVIGDSLWAYDYDMYSYCVQETFDGGFIVLGGDKGYGSDTYLILVKTDSEGEILWKRTYGDAADNSYTGLFIQETSDSGFIVTGSRYIYINEDEWTQKILLLKTDLHGDSLWSRIYEDETLEWRYDVGYCVRQTTDGGYIVTGHKSIAPSGLRIIKTDAVGDTIWTRTYSTSLGGEGYSVQKTEDGGYIVVGTTTNFTYTTVNPAECDLWLLKTDSQGDTIWAKRYPGGGREAVGKCVQQTEDEGYIITGVLNGDLYLLKTDSLGQLAVEEQSSETVKNWKLEVSIGHQAVLHYLNWPGGFEARVFDVSGREIDQIVCQNNSGTIAWGSSYSPGVYFMKVNETLNKTTAVKVVIIH